MKFFYYHHYSTGPVFAGVEGDTYQRGFLYDIIDLYEDTAYGRSISLATRDSQYINYDTVVNPVYFEIVQWLREQGIEFDLAKVGCWEGMYLITFDRFDIPNDDDAALFKLRWL